MSEYTAPCPQCRQVILCDSAYAGKRVFCPVCLQEIAMPAPPQNPGLPAGGEPSRREPAGGRRTSWIAGLVAGALVAGAGGWLVFKGNSKMASPVVSTPSQVALAAQPAAQAEIQSKTSQAAALVVQGQYGAADQILAGLATPPTEPTSDAISAYRAVGEWLALQGRWQEAASRYYALVTIDKLDDWNQVTLDYQACAAALAENGEKAYYDRMCQAAIAQYGKTSNGDLAGRIIKACLLLPANAATMAQLQPLAEVADQTFDPNTQFPDWAVIHLGLWQYRHGDYRKAIAWCQRVENKDQGTAIEATMLILRAMSDFHTGKMADARTGLALGRQKIQARLQTDWEHGNQNDGIWYDWAFAQILLREATELIGKS